MLIGVFFTPMSQSQECNARINKEAGVKNTPASVRFVRFSLWATAPGGPGEAKNKTRRVPANAFTQFQYVSFSPYPSLRATI